MKAFLVFLGLIVSAQPSIAADRAALIGVWKVLSFQTEFKDGSPPRATFGEHPAGYIIFTKEGRMMAVIEGEGRKAPSTDQDRAALLNSLAAYSGAYQVEGNHWTTTVDVAWNPAWQGTKQVRGYKLIGDRLTVTSMWQPSLSIAGSPITRGILVFERVK
jgi:lipocalin-like protein